MYLPAIKTVLKHSHQDVANKLLEETTLKSPEDISCQNLQEVLNQSQKISVHLPSDFHKSGDKGIRLKEEGTEGTIRLKQVIEIQTRGLKYTLALALLMAIWWITEALPISGVALLPMVLLPALSVSHFQHARLPSYFVVFTPYMHRLVILFLGGFTTGTGPLDWTGLYPVTPNLKKPLRRSAYNTYPVKVKIVGEWRWIDFSQALIKRVWCHT